MGGRVPADNIKEVMNSSQGIPHILNTRLLGVDIHLHVRVFIASLASFAFSLDWDGRNIGRIDSIRNGGRRRDAVGGDRRRCLRHFDRRCAGNVGRCTDSTR